MIARFTGTCLGAGDRVLVGDDIVKDKYGWSHRNHKGFAKTYDAPARGGKWKSGEGDYPMADEIADIRGWGTSDYEWYGGGD